MNEQVLQQVMEQFLDGAVWRVVEQQSGSGNRCVNWQSIFLSMGHWRNIFAGRPVQPRSGRSMHAFFLPFGVYPNNAIVGGSADISVGAALFKKINRRPGLVICNIGDGSLGCGPVWEAFMMATMDQFPPIVAG
jgi:2-oxoisovalerate dehydrogenase E1 component